MPRSRVVLVGATGFVGLAASEALAPTRDVVPVPSLSGGRARRLVPRPFARLLVAAARLVGRVHEPTGANARRLELRWLGQGLPLNWLTKAGWQASVGCEGWRALAAGGS